MTKFSAQNIINFGNQRIASKDGHKMWLIDVCSRNNLRLAFNHKTWLNTYTLTLIDLDQPFDLREIFKSKNFEEATRDVVKYINDKIDATSPKYSLVNV